MKILADSHSIYIEIENNRKLNFIANHKVVEYIIIEENGINIILLDDSDLKDFIYTLSNSLISHKPMEFNAKGKNITFSKEEVAFIYKTYHIITR